MFKLTQIIEATGGRIYNFTSDLEIEGISIDSRTIKEGEAFIAIKGNRFDGHDFIEEAIDKKARLIVVSKKPKKIYPVPFILVKDTTEALGDIARYNRKRFSVPVIAITGSNGKTTAKEMLSFVLSKRFKVLKNEGTQNNQIGLPLTLLKLDRSYKIVVVELGTNHFGEIEYLSKIASPNIGIILNIGPSHLEFFKDLKGVFKEKYSLIDNLSFPYIGILNADDPLLSYSLKTNKEKFLISFGIKKRCDFKADNLKISKDFLTFKVNKQNFFLRTLGAFNVYNALVSIAVARLFGMSYTELINQLKEFKFPPSRLQKRIINGALFIDDTYNANPLSLAEALKVLKMIKKDGRKIIVLGDMLELGSSEVEFHLQAGLQISQICDIMISVGKRAGISAEVFKKKVKKNNAVFMCNSSLEAKNILFNKIKPKKKDVVLLKGSRLMQLEKILE